MQKHLSLLLPPQLLFLCLLVEPGSHLRLSSLAPDGLGHLGESQTEARRLGGEPEELAQRTEFHE